MHLTCNVEKLVLRKVMLVWFQKQRFVVEAEFAIGQKRETKHKQSTKVE